MTGLEVLKNPETTAEEIANIVSAPCPPIAPKECDKVSCRECWLAWLATGELPEKKESPDKQTTPEDRGEGLCVGQTYEMRSHEVQVDVLTKVVSFRQVSGEPICDLIWKRENEYDSYRNTATIYHHPALPTPSTDDEGQS